MLDSLRFQALFLHFLTWILMVRFKELTSFFKVDEPLLCARLRIQFRVDIRDRIEGSSVKEPVLFSCNGTAMDSAFFRKVTKFTIAVSIIVLVDKLDTRDKSIILSMDVLKVFQLALE